MYKAYALKIKLLLSTYSTRGKHENVILHLMSWNDNSTALLSVFQIKSNFYFYKDIFDYSRCYDSNVSGIQSDTTVLELYS